MWAFSRAICMILWGIEPYALAMSSHVTTRFFFSAFASLISWDNMAVCSRQPEIPGIPPFWIDVSMKLLAIKNLVILSAFIEKKSLPSTFKSEIVLYFSIVSAPSSLGMNIPSASCQLLHTLFFFHRSLR